MRRQPNRLDVVEIEVNLHPTDAPHFIIKQNPKLEHKITVETPLFFISLRQLIQPGSSACLLKIYWRTRGKLSLTLWKVRPIVLGLFSLQLCITVIVTHMLRLRVSVVNMVGLGP